MTLPAVISLRVSTEEQAEEGYSLSAQERACRMHCELMGWSVVAVCVDEGLSGTLPPASRPGLAAALQLIRSGQARALVVHKLDRLARSVRIANELIEEFERRNVAFVAVADRIDLSTPFGWAAFQMQNVWNELYIKNLSFETKKGHREKAAKGFWVGPVPYGYTRDGKTLAPSDCTAPGAPASVAAAVRVIFETYATGLHSDESLASEMNRQGFRTLNWQTNAWGLFGRESIRAILTNRAYLGYVSSGGVEFVGQHPPLISADLWAAVQAIRAARGHGGTFNTAPKGGEMLTGCVYCADCLSLMRRHWTGRDTGRVARYRCSGPRAAGVRHRDCTAPMVRADWIEQEIVQLISRIRLTPDVRAYVEEAARDADAPTTATVDRAALHAKLERLGEVYADGLLSKEKYQQQRTDLLAQLAELEAARVSEGPALETVLAYADDLPTLLKAATPDEARAIVAPVLSHIWVRDRAVHAITPTRAFEALLVGVWRSEVVLGCPTGIRPLRTTPRRIHLWHYDGSAILAA